MPTLTLALLSMDFIKCADKALSKVIVLRNNKWFCTFDEFDELKQTYEIPCTHF